MIKVIIADDHIFVRKGIISFIEENSSTIKIIDEADNGENLLNKALYNRADVYIIDITMSDMNGFEIVEKLNKIHKKSKIIFLTMHNNKIFLEKAISIGVKGYLLKDDSASDIINAIEQVNNGNYYISAKISNNLINKTNFITDIEKFKLKKLTKRENDILQLIGKGLQSKEIAERLFISLNTVNTHRKNISRKLDIHNISDLTKYALKIGLIKI